MADPLTEEEQHLYEARAARLLSQRSREPERTERVVVFERAGSRYALSAVDLLAVRILPRPTPLLGAPPHVLGLVYLSGRIVPVVDLERLTQPDAPPPQPMWAVWMTREPSSALVVADTVVGTEDILQSQISSPLKGNFSGPLRHALRAVLPGALRLLDVHQLIQPELFSP